MTHGSMPFSHGSVWQKSLGVVLYCNPNAGHYECFTHTPFSSDWVDFYTSLGCDMFLFNYRGYGRSTGTQRMMGQHAWL